MTAASLKPETREGYDTRWCKARRNAHAYIALQQIYTALRQKFIYFLYIYIHEYYGIYFHNFRRPYCIFARFLADFVKNKSQNTILKMKFYFAMPNDAREFHGSCSLWRV